MKTCSGGETGRRAGLKILFPVMEVRVRFPSRAPMNKIVSSIVLFVILSCNPQNNGGRYIDENDTSFSEEVRAISLKINQSSENSKLYFQRGNTFYYEKRFIDAIKDFENAIQLDSTESTYHLRCAESWLALDSVNPIQVKKHLTKAIELNPKFYEAKMQLAKFYLARQQYTEALILLSNLSKEPEFQDDALVMTAIAFKEQKDSLSAENWIDKALIVNPQNFNAVMQKTLFLIARNDKMSLQWANKAVRMNEFNDEAIYSLGLILQRQGKYADAILNYNKAVKVNPSHLLAQYNIAVIESIFENYDRSIEWCNKINDLQPNFEKAFTLKGYCYELLGNNKAALKEYKAALLLNPNSELAKLGIKNIQ